MIAISMMMVPCEEGGGIGMKDTIFLCVGGHSKVLAGGSAAWSLNSTVLPENAAACDM